MTATTETGQSSATRSSGGRGSRPPGPVELPYVGSAIPLLRDSLAFLTQMKERYGDVARFHLTGQEVWLLSHPDHIEEVVRAQSDHLVKDEFTHMIGLVVGNGLLTSEGDFWRRQRRLAQPAFHHHRVRGYGEAMVRRAEQAATRLAEGNTRDVHTDMMRLTLEIVAETLFGIEAGGVEAAIGAALETVTDRFAGIGIFIPIAIPTPGNLRLKRSLRRLDEAIYGIIHERRTQADTGDLLSTLLAATTEEGGGMSDQQLRDEVVTLLLAGHETTALVLSFALHVLAEHPDVQDTLAAECARVLGGRAPTIDDLPALTYADAVVRETMRLYPPAWSIGREVTAPCRVGGYDVPLGTQIWAAQWVVHRDPRFFEAPGDFRPERWQGDFAKRLHRFAYFPFGGGPRVCIGQSFAMMEAVLLLVTLVQRLRVAPGDRPLELSPSITLRPRNGVRLSVERRG